MSLISRLIYARRGPLKRVVKEALALYGVEVPAPVEIGAGLRVMHRGFGTVIHPSTTIGDDVTIYHGVTIGRADAHLPSDQTRMERIDIGDGAVLFPGSVILGGPGVTRVGRGTIVAANAVLTKSTGDNEVWAGVPAKKVPD